MTNVVRWIRSNALSVALLLTAGAAAVSIYAVIQVQDERSAAILRECQAQNSRHTGTIAELDTLMARFGKGASPARRAELNASRGFTVLLIDQLAPYQNCQRVLAKSQTK